MKDVTALILAAGVGKRFWPLTYSKSLFAFAGEPLVLTTMHRLLSAGVKKFVVVAAPQDRGAIESFSLPGAVVSVVEQHEASGMGDAILLAAEQMEAGPVVILNAHDYVDEGLYESILAHTKDGVAFVVGKKVDSYIDVGYLRVDGERLLEIVEKPGAGREPSDLVNLMFHFFPDIGELASVIRGVTTQRDDRYEVGVSRYLESNRVNVFSYSGPWQPLKYPWHILDMLPHFLGELRSKKGRNVVIAKNVVIEGEVVIEDDVRIFENTKIIGPCYIGKGTIIGNNNIIRESYIGEGCVTGFNTDITRSWVGDKSWFHSNYIGDSVIAGDVSLGGGTKLANLRLDDGEVYSVIGGKKVNTGRTKFGAVVGAGVRVGVNASIMPGVKIGTGSFIGAGVILDKDLPEDSFCYARPGYEVKPNTKKSSSAARDAFKTKL